MKRSLTHAASIGGQAASNVEAVALAEAMSRDGPRRLRREPRTKSDSASRRRSGRLEHANRGAGRSARLKWKPFTVCGSRAPRQRRSARRGTGRRKLIISGETMI
jgi:hypothetical protein